MYQFLKSGNICKCIHFHSLTSVIASAIFSQALSPTDTQTTTPTTVSLALLASTAQDGDVLYPMVTAMKAGTVWRALLLGNLMEPMVIGVWLVMLAL